MTTVATTQAAPSLAGRLMLGGVILLTILALIYFDFTKYLSLETIKTHRDRLLELTEAHYPLAAGAFIATYILQTACSLPGATVMTLLGGFLFGSVLGMLFVNVGATLGATLAFLAARYLLQAWVQRRFGDRLAALQEGFAKNAFSYLLTLRLIPLFPFFVVNLLSGLTRVKTRTYMAVTSLGIIPGSFVYTYAGSQLGSINSLAEIASPRIALALTFLGLLSFSSVLYRRLTDRA
ncbi:MAG: TVP38/TMEM64 family protein [Nitrospira sp.]|nr:TVP38/TMEM64 family protein [Nitrospira sp.]